MNVIIDHINLISSKEISDNIKNQMDTLFKTLNVKIHIPKCNPIDGCREENCTRHK